MKKGFSKEEIKTLGLSSLGGTLEFYDFIIFVFFTKYFIHHFVPTDLSDAWQQISGYGAFAAAYLARPLGGVVMAHFGDKFGRKNMFMLSILLMVIPTFALAIMPTFESIGYLAPIILIVIRILQGIAIGGELPGAWVFVREHSPEDKKGAYLGLLTSSVVGGILLGSIVALIMSLNFSTNELKEWAWRIPFALGGIFGIISIYLRRYLSETPIFKKMKEKNEIAQFPIKEVLENHKISIYTSMLVTWVLTACVVVFLLIAPNFAQAVMKFDEVSNICLQVAGIFFVMIGNISAGSLSDNFSIPKVCQFFAVFWGLFGFLYFYELYVHQNIILLAITYLIACYFAGVMVFTPLIMTEIFPANIRFSGISFSYNLAYAVAGFFTPILLPTLHIAATQGSNSSFEQVLKYGGGVYVVVVACVAYISASLVKKRV